MLIRSLFMAIGVLGVVTSVSAQGIREVRYTDKQSIQVISQMRFGTMIVLPQNEPIVDAHCADKEFWIIEAVKNAPHAVSIKPAKTGAGTTLFLVGASGMIYTFALREGSAKTDEKIFVLRDDAGFSDVARRYYSEDEVEALRGRIRDAERELVEAKGAAAQVLEGVRADYPVRMRFDYIYGVPPPEFSVRALWHDDRFTYLDVRTRELPALYEERDSEPSVPEYQIRDGRLYVIPHVVERGYLQVGKKKWHFQLATGKEPRP